MPKALVNRIIPFSCVDGPGNRTAIFLQGCNLNCLYCHNPETIKQCTGCGACVSICPMKALSKLHGRVEWNESICCSCDQCIKTCTNNSSPKAQWLSVAEVLERIKPNLPFISGITVSGGECTLQADFAASLFEEVKKKGKTTYVDSNGMIRFQDMPQLTKVMDQAMIDIKAYDSEQHQMLTGYKNEQVIENIRYLANIGKLFEIRTVIVPGLLNNLHCVDKASRLIAPFKEVRYKLIKYRSWGVRKECAEFVSPTEEMMEELKAIALENGVTNVVII